ncbi:hypothetical protein [Gordonia sp. (in: high G+C Gram-positive bacteria)]|jgi:hypothetical protein|uniref:hypothetical protein n=1 Tax=Gordonia sp. (in: high G+C Gram-positive bacteria) TaxID=84139 RepID=UPI001DB15F9E|nr:hypothetical protein [Gordonia sp. (in: high G+C Gram-positive bacteria)]MCB1297069.1 hypothetical protein [Gordonia sp. (in: high G+C Gram-positive bacteria)]HMS74134.1 hypothetical protein [Gordonia sp. (in: high G+C Gram-positive bacteria)]
MEQLHQLADDLRETFDERGYRIGVATGQDPSFRNSRRSQASLTRDLALDAIREGCGRLGLHCRSGSGGSLEVVTLVGDTYRHHRVLKATFDKASEAYVIVCRGDNALLAADDASVYPAESWVFAYTIGDDGMLDEIFVAKVQGVTDGAMRQLILGPVTLLGSAGTMPPSGFRPADEADLGLDDDEENEGGVGGAV